jgi:hypothetical protein
MSEDEKLAQAVRDAAGKLAEAMSAAGEAGLLVEVNLENATAEYVGNRIIRKWGHQPSVRVSRTIEI